MALKSVGGIGEKKSCVCPVTKRLRESPSRDSRERRVADEQRKQVEGDSERIGSRQCPEYTLVLCPMA